MLKVRFIKFYYSILLWWYKKTSTVWYYKNKPYRIYKHSKINIDSEWENVIIYKNLYYNPNGKIWVRYESSFFLLFRTKTETYGT